MERFCNVLYNSTVEGLPGVSVGTYLGCTKTSTLNYCILSLETTKKLTALTNTKMLYRESENVFFHSWKNIFLRWNLSFYKNMQFKDLHILADGFSFRTRMALDVLCTLFSFFVYLSRPITWSEKQKVFTLLLALIVKYSLLSWFSIRECI